MSKKIEKLDENKLDWTIGHVKGDVHTLLEFVLF